MLPKKLINKCLFLLNNTCRYTNVSYSLNVYNDHICIDVYIWKLDEVDIIKGFHCTIRDKHSFNRFFADIPDFIKENKEFIK